MLVLAGSGADEGSWLCARRQSSGRGRMGRNWESPEGNFSGSTVIRVRPGDPPPPTLAFVAAVTLIEVLKSCAPLLKFALKWPNDVLCDGWKISGILLERTGDAVVLGIGVNLAHHPQSLERPATSLAAHGLAPPDPNAFAAQLAEHFAQWLTRWRREGITTVLAAWHGYAHFPGTALKVSLPDDVVLHGSYDGLGADGALLLRLADGAVRAIHAGDVFLV